MAIATNHRVQQLVRKHVPEVDDTILEYIIGYLSELPEDGEGVADFVQPLLLDAGGDSDAIEKLCLELQNIFSEQQAAVQDKNTRPQGLAKLEQPINMLTSQSLTSEFGRGATDLTHVGGNRMQSQVDTKKLEKAEAKIKAKMEKRERRADYEASKLLTAKQANEAFLAVNPILDYTTTKGKVKDIKIENFDISFSGKRILTNASLTLGYGRRYGLVGRNGVGKSTLLRAMSRREINVPSHISILHVEQEMAGDDTPALQAVLSADAWREHLLSEEKRLNAQIGSSDGKQVETDADEETIGLQDQLKEVYAKLQEIESDKAESRASAILSGLGFLPETQQNPTRTFSGGWRMRLALARALFCKPDCLLLDEPTNMLDIPAVVWLENYLKKWPNTLLVVSHDREFLDDVATDILHQHSEQLDAYKGNFTQFYATKDERRKNQLREYESQQQYRQHLQDFIDRWRYNAKRAPQAQSKIKILEKLPVLEPPEDESTITFRFPDPDSLSPPVLQMSDVTFGYNEGQTILSNVSFDLQMDSRIAVVGPNGAGKSTMLKLLTGKHEPRAGLVHRHGRLRFALFTQHHVDQLDVNVSAVQFMAQKWPGRPEEEYRRHLATFGITGTVGLQQVSTLSGGQKSRVAFACLGLQNPHVLILDEPTNHLDMDSIDALTAAVKQFGGGVVIVSHDQRFIDGTCNEIWVCANKELTKFRGEGIKEYKKMIAPDEV